ncbi:L-serine ammonia-lyase [Actinotignum timonense]|nr:L-serine ammonia-lyase [Actinotignum timonense]MDK6907393.1 L-serine ammonia-lyase [Actinotignum timonense]MDK8782732.1 L-serine ammonia-lyase [Actinotignum timonense]
MTSRLRLNPDFDDAAHTVPVSLSERHPGTPHTALPAAILAGETQVTGATGESGEEETRANPLGVCDMFRVGIGPSSSHTVGPMRAGLHFATLLAARAPGARITSLRVDLFGSLAATGRGHNTDRAVLLGLSGYSPENVSIAVVDGLEAAIDSSGTLTVPGFEPTPFVRERDIIFRPRDILPYHVNALTLRAWAGEALLAEHTYYSVGGGFVMEELGDPAEPRVAPLATEEQADAAQTAVPYPFFTAARLLELCSETGMRISELALANETALRPQPAVIAHMDRVHAVMDEAIKAGIATEGTLPGGLRVKRRAPGLARELEEKTAAGHRADQLEALGWVNLFALAINEENAAGHRIVTAPTNGAAGVVPAVLTYYERFVPGATREGMYNFLLAGAAIGGIIKTNASIAGAEVGCQGEVGSASAMAAAGFAEALGGTPAQVENAAEIAMEHSLGLTCDPVGGLVQIPCIERNAMAAVKSINAAYIALWGDGSHTVSFDTVVETMRQTGMDMLSKYKETSEGGLAVNVVEC